MEDIIREMIWQAEKEDNCQLIKYVKQLIEEFAETINCPSNWRSIGVELTEEDVDAVERQIIKNNLTLNNAIEAVLLGISNSLK